MDNASLATLCQFISALNYQDLAADVISKAKLHIADTFAALLAGTCSQEYQQVSRTFGDQPLSPRDVALLYGVAAHGFEVDDSGGCDHSGAVVIPALLAALAQTSRPVTGEQLIVAVVVGYEVGRRILEAAGGYHAHNSLGWHSTGTCGTLAAASAVAKLWGFEREQCQHAITLATSFSSGLWAFIHDGSQAKKLHAGRAAEGGLLAAQLAAQHVAGPSLVFSDVWGGFFNSFNHGQGAPELLANHLGEDWRIHRAIIKPYASCRGAHSSLDALMDILHANQREAVEIEHIEVELNPMLMAMCGAKTCHSLAAAQMSLPYALAAYLLYGSAGLESYAERKRLDSRIPSYLAKITLLVNDQMANLDEPNITVHFYDRHQAWTTVPRATGSLERPMARAACEAKFFSLAQMALSQSAAQALNQTLSELELLADCAPFTSLLPAGAETQALFY